MKHIKKFNEEVDNSVVDKTFKEIDERLSILNKETLNWLKQSIMTHISEAYERGKSEK